MVLFILPFQHLDHTEKQFTSLFSLSPTYLSTFLTPNFSSYRCVWYTGQILYLRGTSLTRKMKHCEVISPRSIHKVIDDSNQSPHQLRLKQLETVFGFVWTIGGNSTRQLTITDYPTSCKPVFTSASVRSVFVGTNRIFVTRAAILWTLVNVYVPGKEVKRSRSLLKSILY